MPKVSVIVPVYNTEKYLEKCLDSLTGQTLKDIEIICVNDCSPDNSLTILQKYAAIDNRIKIIDFKENQGAAIARNTGIDAATGDYIGFVDSDDYVDLDFYEKLYTKAIETDADIVKGKIIIDDKVTLFEPHWQIKSFDFLKNPEKFIYGFTTAIYRANLIKHNNIKFPENIKNLEDPYFLIWAVARACHFDTDENAKYYYQTHDNSSSHNTSSEDILNGAQKILELINFLNLPKKHYISIFNFIYDEILVRNISNEKRKEFLDSSLYKKDIMLERLKKIRQESHHFKPTKSKQELLISVVIPVYKVEQYLAKCLDSVINQTYKNLEIICVNDCSPDNSAQILQEYAAKDNRINIINHEKNSGLSAARNTGLKIATGEYIYFIDSDDWIDDDYVEKMVNIAVKEKSDIILNTNILNEYEDGTNKEFVWESYTKKIPYGELITREHAVNDTHCMTWCHFYKLDFLIQNKLLFPVGYIHEDNYFNYITKINSDKIFAFHGASYHYLQRTNSIMGANSKKHNLFYLKIAKLICEFDKNNPQLKKYKTKLAEIQAFFPITSEELFDLAHYVCEYIKNRNYDLYNAFDAFCIKAVATSVNYKTYLDNYPKGLRIAYLHNHIHKNARG